MHRTLMVILLVAMPITCSAGKASAPWNATWTCSFMDEICTQQADSSILPNYPDWQPHKAKCPLSPEKASTAAHAELKRVFPAITAWRTMSVSLKRVASETDDSPWFYAVHCQPADRDSLNQYSGLTINVGLDGKVPELIRSTDPERRLTYKEKLKKRRLAEAQRILNAGPPAEAAAETAVTTEP